MGSDAIEKTFPFDSAAQVLAFAVRAARLAEAAGVGARVRQSAGLVSVALTVAGSAEGPGAVIEELDRAAAAVRGCRTCAAVLGGLLVPGVGYTVAVVDDDQAIRQLLRRTLGLAGYATETSASGTVCPV